MLVRCPAIAMERFFSTLRLWVNHIFGAYQLVELCSRDMAALDGFFLERGAVFMRGLGDFCSRVVANLGRESRNQHEGAFQRHLYVVTPGLDADDAVVG